MKNVFEHQPQKSSTHSIEILQKNLIKVGVSMKKKTERKRNRICLCNCVFYDCDYCENDS
jgi:hypothetical protein